MIRFPAIPLGCSLLILSCLQSRGNAQDAPAVKPLRLAIAGLVHGHVSGFLRNAMNRKDVELVGIFDSAATPGPRHAKDFSLAAGLVFTDLATMLNRTRPEAVATFTST